MRDFTKALTDEVKRVFGEGNCRRKSLLLQHLNPDFSKPGDVTYEQIVKRMLKSFGEPSVTALHLDVYQLQCADRFYYGTPEQQAVCRVLLEKKNSRAGLLRRLLESGCHTREELEARLNVIDNSVSSESPKDFVTPSVDPSLVHKLEEKLKESIEDRALLQRTIDEQASQLISVQIKQKTATEDICRLEGDLKRKDVELDQLRQASQKASAIQQDLRQRCKKSEESLEATRRDLIVERRRTGILQITEAKCKSLDDRVKYLTKEKKGLEDKIQSLQAQIKERTDDKDNRIKELSFQLSDTTEKLLDAQNEVRKLQLRLETLAATEAKIRDTLTNVQTEAGLVNLDLEDERKKRIAAEKTSAELQVEKAKLQKAVDRYREAFENGVSGKDDGRNKGFPTYSPVVGNITCSEKFHNAYEKLSLADRQPIDIFVAKICRLGPAHSKFKSNRVAGGDLFKLRSGKWAIFLSQHDGENRGITFEDFKINN